MDTLFSLLEVYAINTLVTELISNSCLQIEFESNYAKFDSEIQNPNVKFNQSWKKFAINCS
jgi:hypothetical protein